jgi:NADPH:quinone reductase-like Zn-dependent oxidoreductase
MLNREAFQPRDKVLPTAEAAESHRIVEANENVGKIVLAW